MLKYACCVWLVATLVVMPSNAEDEPLGPGEFLSLFEQARAPQAKRDWSSVAATLEQAVRINPTVGLAWFELGMAQARAKNFPRAVEAFLRADAVGAFRWEGPSIVGRGEALLQAAGCYAQLGKTEEALAHLERAMAAGLRRPRRLVADAKLEPLRAHPRLRELAGIVEPEPNDRVSGYRGDLKFLAREMIRLHPNPFREHPREEMDREVQSLDQEIPTLSDEAVAVRFKRLVTLLGDGHSNLWIDEAQVIGLRFFWFEEGLFVVAAQPGLEQWLGAQVLAFNNHPFDEVVARFEPITARDNEMTLRSFIPNMLSVADFHVGLGLHDSTTALPLTLVRPGGEPEEVTLPTQRRTIADRDRPRPWIETLPGQMPPLARSRPGSLLWFEPVAEGRVVYAAIDGMGNDKNETFEAFSQRLLAYVDEHKEVERLVLDFRRNGGGNTFLNRPLVQGLMTSRLNRRGALMVLIGRSTFSAAQNTVTEIARHTSAVFVGEPTGSRPNFIGESVVFALPYSKWEVSISDLYWETSSPLDFRKWLEPELYVPPRADDHFAGRDPAINLCLNWQVKE